jgi:hypothetical protein
MLLNRFVPIIFLVTLSALLMVAGIAPQFLNFKFLSLLFFSGIGLIIFSLSLENAFFVFFFYLGIEGVAKMLSQYHPIIHVGTDIIVLSLLLRTFLSLLLNRAELPKRIPFLMSLLFLHFIWFLIVFMNPYALSLQASLAAIKLYVVPQLLFFFGFYLCRNARQMEKFFLPWILVVVLHVVFGLYQGMIGPASVTSWSPTYQQVLARYIGYPFRPFGLTSLPGGPAVFSYFVIPILVFGFLVTSSWLRKFVISLIIFGLILILLLCQVKSAIIKFIGAIFLFLIMALFKRNQVGSQVTGGIVKFLFAIAVIGAFALPSVLDRISDANTDNHDAIARSLKAFDFEIMGQARQGALDRFITYAQMAPLGSGLSRIGPAVYRFHDQISANQYFKSVIFFSDNLWVQLVIDIGIPGVFMISVIVFLIFLQGYRAWRQSKSARASLAIAAVLTGMAAIFSGAYGAEPILYNPEAGFFWFFAGALFRLTMKDSDQEQNL